MDYITKWIQQHCSFIVLPLQTDEVYLNLVLDFVPETVYRVARHFNKAKTTIPIIYVKVMHSLLLLFPCFSYYFPSLLSSFSLSLVFFHTLFLTLPLSHSVCLSSPHLSLALSPLHRFSLSSMLLEAELSI